MAWRGPSVALALLLFAACGPASPRDAGVTTEPAQADGGPVGEEGADADTIRTVVDSIFPIEEELRRFREGLEEVTFLADHAPRSPDALVRRFFQALAASDTAALAGLLLDRAEYAYLYYPSTKMTKPPYEMSPRLHWFLMRQDNQKGFIRVLRRYGGKAIQLNGYECSERPVSEGENRLWHGCSVSIDVDGNSMKLALFGSILERSGRFKFVSYANDL